MINVYREVNTLDTRCYEKFDLTPDLLMENAINALSNEIQKHNPKDILIISGSGNNGADGIALARMLYAKHNIDLYPILEPKSKMAKLQYKRALAIGLTPITNPKINEYDLIVDSIFGSGLSSAMPKNIISLINQINEAKAIKIACDSPSGIDINGNIKTTAFKADTTITMGAMKKSLLSDTAKDYVGKIQIVNLGIDKSIYQTQTDTFLLESSDLKLPIRNSENTHKGTFGFASIYSNNGAGILSAKACINMGCGKCSIISKENLNIPEYILQEDTLNKNSNALCIGMGLGFDFDTSSLFDIDIPILIDADLFHYKDLSKLLDSKDNLILTPHPKEFLALLKNTNLGNYSIKDYQENRFELLEKFSKKYPDIVLLLKGANTVITYKNKTYINNQGNSMLSFAGSGDILAGIITSLLAQTRCLLDATINGSLIHAMGAKNYSKNNYSFGTQDLLKSIKTIQVI
ncbi:MAG: NAD(P)HX epimerase / NAD(P)HX dehydratase [uncultured Campylobacterales bacterium]|uniref:NAD(P)H-hydrate epimerase n=1 Tax=uncultured Campylobacterales bacterium TaxID=352960 RepID=A0A6S6T8X6_9BACT|nr:MAG: NAD(P)HX epimerase / NAD(P)HX dehydratase [uncultured Campylobacterales bacterium]